MEVKGEIDSWRESSETARDYTFVCGGTFDSVLAMQQITRLSKEKQLGNVNQEGESVIN